MAKEAYYFSHDSNARHDPDIGQMRSVYKMLGYAWFWVLIEMMRDANEHKLSMQGKYIWNAYASELQCNAEEARQFVEDCINEFNLFASDGRFFWSESLLRRMEKKTTTSEKRSAAAKKRWDKDRTNTEFPDDNMQMHDVSNAIAMQGKESKRNKSKVKEIKEKEIKDKTAFEAYTSNPVLLSSLNSFIEFRMKIRKPMTDRAVSLLLSNLDKLGKDDKEKISILEQSILNGWQGIFALKDQGGAANAKPREFTQGVRSGGHSGQSEYAHLDKPGWSRRA
ncbi:uncharacterized protein DUF4373 [Paenibacillus cellulosilyticus]|uniref:Uncharacterized protein DUF4373 n=2 Tax=Paenibacillus cellulosilyticus TaxID=375489 RepID=A0A2V2Z617_9BACL|nr:uncharacterized protein DUF4373 [Paenibacillus cellulosilyticus]